MKEVNKIKVIIFKNLAIGFDSLISLESDLTSLESDFDTN